MAPDWADVVRRFEDLTLPLTEWNHAAHLAVTTHYLTIVSYQDAVERVRNGIQRFNDAKGIVQTPTSGYHDTLTRFFVHIIAASLAEPEAPAGFGPRLAIVQARFADKKMVLSWYSRERIMSPEAWTGWVEPDLRPLPRYPPAPCETPLSSVSSVSG